MYRHFFKRFFDIVLSLIGIIILALPMLIIALIIKIDSRGPVLFKQKRVGKMGRVFTMYKFRSMKVNAENINELANAINYIAQNIHQYNRKAIAEDCQARFSSKVIAQQLTDIFEETIKRYKEKQ